MQKRARSPPSEMTNEELMEENKRLKTELELSKTQALLSKARKEIKVLKRDSDKSDYILEQVTNACLCEECERIVEKIMEDADKEHGTSDDDEF